MTNRGISNQSSKISVSQIMSQAESDGVDKCVDYMTTHLCHRESSSDNIQQETVQLDVSPPEAQPEEFLQIQTEQPYEDIQPNPPFSCIEHSPHSDTSLQYTNSPQVSEQDRKKEWMLRHGVDPISPVYDNKARKTVVEKRIDKFLSVLSTRAHLVPASHSSLLHVEESSSVAIPAGDHEIDYLDSESSSRSMGHALAPRAHYKSTIQPEAKRRVIGVPSKLRVNLEKAQSIVRQQMLSPHANPNVRFVERVGRPRMVAGAVWQPRYLEGVDENVSVRGETD